VAEQRDTCIRKLIIYVYHVDRAFGSKDSPIDQFNEILDQTAKCMPLTVWLRGMVLAHILSIIIFDRGMIFMLLFLKSETCVA